MLLTRLIPERYRSLVKELLTFGTVGGINTILGQVMFNIFLGLGLLTANTISTTIATGCSFVLNRHVTYRHRPRTSLRRELPMFAGLNLIGLGIQLGILDGARDFFDLTSADRLDLNLARFGGVVVGTIFLLLTYRTFVFKAAPAGPTANAATPALPEPAEAITGAPVPAGPVATIPIQMQDTEEFEFGALTEPLESEFTPEPITASYPIEPAITR